MVLAVPQRFRAVNWLLAALFVAAAVRGLVPGMCGTLNALEAGERAASGCCAMPAAEAEDGALTLEAAPESHPPCAFCTLTFAPMTPAAAVIPPIPAATVLEAATFPHPAAPGAADESGLVPGRSPPSAIR